MNEHVISEELLNEARFAFSNNEHWIAYNTIPYFLEDSDMYFFKTSDEAHEFSDNNISEYDNYRVIHALSIDELLKQIPYGEKLDKQISNLKFSIMNEKNLEALKGNLKYLGFGEGLNEQLEKNIAEQKPDFTLQHQVEFNSRKIDATLHFRAGNENEMYFFNRYDAKLDDRQQTFYLDRGNGVTMKEAFNLLDGRAVNKDLVNKEGTKYNAWVQLDFEAKEQNGNYKMNRYHENYGYNIEVAISKYPIKELADEKLKADLIRSLEKGNQQSVRLEIGGKEELHFMQADPKNKDMIITDRSGNRLSKEQSDSLKIPDKQKLNGKEVSQEQKKEQKQSATAEDDEGPELKKKRTRKQGKGLSA